MNEVGTTGQVRSGQVGSGWVGSGRFLLGRDRIRYLRLEDDSSRSLAVK